MSPIQRRRYLCHGLLWLTVVSLGLIGCATPRQLVTRLGSDPSSVIRETMTLPLSGEGSVAAEAREDDASSVPAVEGGGRDVSVRPEAEPVDWANPFSGEYRIESGDVLDFLSFDDPTLNQQVVVRYDGHISLPLIPDTAVGNATRTEATELIREAYEAVFRDPQISLVIRDPNSKSFYVMGDVNTPSEYPYRRKLTLLDAINTGGGLRLERQAGDAFVGAQGQLTKALIIRHVDERREVLEYDMRNLSEPGPHQSDAPVLPGDIVYVPEGVNLVYVIGAAQRPGVFKWSETMGLIDLLARSGGPVFGQAKLRRVVLLRPVDPAHVTVMLVDVHKILNTGQDFGLQPGDTIYIPRKDLVRLQEFVGRFTGTISSVLQLYNLALESYYTKERLELIVEGDIGSSVPALLQSLNTFAGFSTIIQPTPVP